jgi:hypothetical protein
MSNVIQIIAEDSDDLLNTGAYGAGALIRVQTSATMGGAYADLTGTGATPTLPLVAGDRTYTAYDPAGAVTSWYRTRYENVGGTRLSDWSAAFQAGDVSDGYLCSVGQVKARLFPGGTSDTTDDVLIAELVAEVSAWIEGFTGRRFTPETATYVFDTTAGRSLFVARGIRSVTSIGVASSHQPDTGGSYTALTAADVLLRPKAVDLPAGWPATEVRLSLASTTQTYFYSAENGCTITGEFGFAAPPADVAAVAIDAVVAAYQARRNGASSVMGADDMPMPPWAKFFGRGSPQRGTLERYRYLTL